MFKTFLYYYYIKMSNIIIELSNNKAQSKVSNGDFDTTFEPITINQGDVIQVKNAFIDTVQQNYDQIYLPEDVNIILTICFYEIDVPMNINGGIARKTYSGAHQNGPNANGFLYLCFNIGAYEFPYLKTVQINKIVPKGLYTPTSLAILITKLLTELNYPQNDIPSGQNGWPQSPFVFIPSPGTTHFCRLHQIDVDTNRQPYIDYEDYYTYTQNASPYNQRFWSGARQVALLYNDQGDNKFQFSMLHTPLYDDGGNVIVNYMSPNIPLPAVTRDSGCMFVDMQPVDFWTNLGFDVPSMLIKFNDIKLPNPTLLDFNNERMTTEQLFTIDNLFGYKFTNVNQNAILARSVVYAAKQSSYSRGISASQFYSFKTLAPFLLIELLTNFNNTYISGLNTSKFISAIVSRNYTQNNYLTGYSDSAIVYQHKGESFLLSSIRVRILDPNTNNTAVDLGPNNYIILSVTKNS